MRSGNPHPPGTVAAEFWDMHDALLGLGEALGGAMWDGADALGAAVARVVYPPPRPVLWGGRPGCDIQIGSERDRRRWRKRTATLNVRVANVRVAIHNAQSFEDTLIRIGKLLNGRSIKYVEPFERDGGAMTRALIRRIGSLR